MSAHGFTLIEVIIGLSILIILAGLGMFLTMDFYRGYTFNYEKHFVISLLQKARSRAMANINQSGHGFYYDGKSYILFEGDDYALRNKSKDAVFPAGKTVALYNMPITGVVFEQLSGNNAALLVLTIMGDGKSADIEINEYGRISY